MDKISSYFYYVEEEVIIPDPREQAFHDTVREYVIVSLILLILYGLSYLILSAYRKRKNDLDPRDPLYPSSHSHQPSTLVTEVDEDAIVYRVSLWMCTFSLATSIGAALLLPFSVVTNEVLLMYPDNFYMQWLNEGLVQRLWNNVFVFSNVSLFVLLPFAYFFTESEGFSGSQRGILSRVNEAIVLLVLLTILVFGITCILCLVLGIRELPLKNIILVWHSLPFLYSCMSFLGVLFLLVCTPVGIARLFTVLGELVVKPRFLRNIQEEYDTTVFEEMHLQRRIEYALRNINRKHPSNHLPNHQNGVAGGGMSLADVSPSRSKSLDSLASRKHHQSEDNESISTTSTSSGWTSIFSSPKGIRLRRKTLEEKKDPEIMALENELLDIRATRKTLEGQLRASAFRRNFGYPMAILVLLALTCTSALLVAQNTLELLVGIKALPVSSAQKFSLGSYSLSKLGLLGSILEIILILYLWCASVVGLYSLPIVSRLRPIIGNTSFTQIIGNCVLLLLLSSALPVLSRIVGITNFDLLGDFGRIEWLGSFNLVFIYNIIFASTTAFALINKFTEPVRRELLRRFWGLFQPDGLFSFLGLYSNTTTQTGRKRSSSSASTSSTTPTPVKSTSTMANGGTTVPTWRKSPSPPLQITLSTSSTIASRDNIDETTPSTTAVKKDV